MLPLGAACSNSLNLLHFTFGNQNINWTVVVGYGYAVCSVRSVPCRGVMRIWIRTGGDHNPGQGIRELDVGVDIILPGGTRYINTPCCPD
jgi:hypothetical protein